MRPPPDRTRATWRRQTTWSWKGRAPRSRRPRAPWRCAFASIGWGPSARDVWRERPAVAERLLHAVNYLRARRRPGAGTGPWGQA